MNVPLDLLLEGFAQALTPANLLYALVGCLVGTLIGVLPGIGPTSGIAILLPLSTVLPPTSAIIMMAAVYYGAMYGGSTTAIVVNIPGEASSVPTAIDGYEMAKQGRAGTALGDCRHLVVRGWDAQPRRSDDLRADPGRRRAFVRPARVLCADGDVARADCQPIRTSRSQGCRSRWSSAWQWPPSGSIR